MKLLTVFLSVLLTLCSARTFAQSPNIYTPEMSRAFPYVRTDSGFALPLKDTNYTRGIIRPGMLTVRPQDSLLYIFNGKKWDLVAVDSTGMQAKIDDKVDSIKIVGDTSYYFKKGVGYGSMFTVSNAYPTLFSYDSTTGALTLFRNGLSPIDINLDGRYPLKIHYHNPSDITGLTTYTRNLFSSGSGIAYNPTTGSIAATGEAAITAPYTGLKYWTGFKTWGSLNTDSLNEGSVNLFYTPARFDTRLATKTTSDLSEGSNLYFTNARVQTYGDANYYPLSSNPSGFALNTNVLHTTGAETKAGVLSLSSNPVFNSMTKGSIFFAGTGGQVNQNNTNLFWDSASNQLQVTGYLAFKDGADGMRWVYNSTNKFASLAPLNLTGGPTGFWNPQTVTAANQSRTNVLTWFTMQRGFYMGVIQSRSNNVLFDASRSVPTVSTYDMGDVVFNAGNVLYFDAKPEVVLWKKIGTTGTTAYQWAEVKGFAEYNMQTTNATATFVGITDITGPGTTKYQMSILAVNSATGETWSEERIYLFGASTGNTYPLIYKDLYTSHTFSEGTMSGCAVNYVFGGGPPSNEITFRVTGLAATTINWRVQVKRMML